jgi:type II secretory pathway component PulL
MAEFLHLGLFQHWVATEEEDLPLEQAALRFRGQALVVKEVAEVESPVPEGRTVR